MKLEIKYEVFLIRTNCISYKFEFSDQKKAVDFLDKSIRSDLYSEGSIKVTIKKGN